MQKMKNDLLLKNIILILIKSQINLFVPVREILALFLVAYHFWVNQKVIATIQLF